MPTHRTFIGLAAAALVAVAAVVALVEVRAAGTSCGSLASPEPGLGLAGSACEDALANRRPWMLGTGIAGLIFAVWWVHLAWQDATAGTPRASREHGDGAVV